MPDEQATFLPDQQDGSSPKRTAGRKVPLVHCACHAIFQHPKRAVLVQCTCSNRTPHPSGVCYLCRSSDVSYRVGEPAHTPPDSPVQPTPVYEQAWFQRRKREARERAAL